MAYDRTDYQFAEWVMGRRLTKSEWEMVAATHRGDSGGCLD